MRPPPSLKQFFAFPITGGVSLLAIAVTGLELSGTSIARLEVSRAAFHGEPWRLVTSALPHVSIFHLAFNVYWLWVFGTLVEEVYGHVRTLAIIVLLAAGSMAAEYALFIGGIGLSGVGYGLFGLLLAVQTRDRRFAGAVDQGTARTFIGWFVLCIVTTVTHVFPVANVAHGVGALIGWCLGRAVATPSTDPSTPTLQRATAAAGLAVCVTASLLGASVLRAIVNVSHNGYEMATIGYEAIEGGRLEDAVKAYREALAIEPKSAASWYNLGIAYHRQKDEAAAFDAYGRAAALDPANPTYRTTLAEAKCHEAFVAQKAGRQEEAVSLYRQCIAEGGGGAWAVTNLGIAFQSLGRSVDDPAVQAEARRLDPRGQLPDSGDAGATVDAGL